MFFWLQHVIGMFVRKDVSDQRRMPTSGVAAAVGRIPRTTSATSSARWPLRSHARATSSKDAAHEFASRMTMFQDAIKVMVETSAKVRGQVGGTKE